MTNSEKMLQALDNENLIEAQLMLQEALQKDDDDTLADLGQELLSLGFLDESRTIFTQLIEKFPEAEGLNIPLAEIAIENDQIDDAFEYLDKISKESDSYVQSLLLSADLYQVIGIPEVSEVKLKEAHNLMPDEPVIQFALGELYFVTGKYTEAIECYERLLTNEVFVVSSVSVNERIGSCYSMIGSFELAIPFLETAIEEQRTDDRLFQLAFTYLQLQENQKAIAILEELRTLNPHYEALYVPLAEALQNEEQLEYARKVLTEGLRENPYKIDLYHAASENAYRLKDSESAVDFLKKGLLLGDKTDETLLTLSNLYIKNQKFEEAISMIDKMEERDNPYAEWNLALAYNELEEFSLARVHFEQAYHELAHEPEFLKEYGLFLREEGQAKEAKNILLHYLQHEPEDHEIHILINEFEE